jgi:uncharacterized protein (TIGR03382 family)
MPRITMKWLAAMTLSALPLVATAQVDIAPPTHSFRFEQGGFAGGAMLSGVLSGRDLDGDGLISSRSGELDSFSLSFKAGTLGHDIDTGPVTGIFTRTQVLVTIDVQRSEIFKPETGGFFFANQEFGFETGKAQVLDPASGQFRTAFAQAVFLDGSNLALRAFDPLVLTATAVPEPATSAMGAVGLLAVAALARRRHRMPGQNAA